MKHYQAIKIVIITEKLIQDGVIRIIESAGATGYTVLPATGKGSRGKRSTERTAVVDEFSNVKIEVITNSREVANHIADRVAETYFANFSGLTYLQDVEVLRPHKF